MKDIPNIYLICENKKPSIMRKSKAIKLKPILYDTKENLENQEKIRKDFLWWLN